jgi:hypothetical protein
MNGKPMCNKICCLLAAMLPWLPDVSAQEQPFRARIAEVDSAGFYRIRITPEIAARAAVDGRDVRIIYQSGKEQPYLREFSREIHSSNVHLFPVVSTTKSAEGHSQLVIRNPSAQPLDELVALLRSSQAVRKAALSGSGDGKEYFSLIDSAVLDARSNPEGDTAICLLRLPQTRYPFLRLTVFNNGLAPPELLGLGIIRDTLLAAKYLPLPPPAIFQKDSSDHRSYIRISFDLPYLIDQLSFLFDGPRYFRRAASLYCKGMEVARFSVEQGAPASLRTALKGEELWLVVENEDNPPLKLRSVRAWQREQHLLAYMKPPEGGLPHPYMLFFGDTTLRAPVYDLRHFRDSIRAMALPETVPAPPERLSGAPKEPQSPKPFLGKGTMWAIILFVFAGLMAATLSLMRQIKKRA